MEISVLSSGSSGNCFYVSNNNSAILIDAGISAKRVITSLELLGKNPEEIQGIFITHEHTDHIKGADVLARKFNIPIFANKKTANSTPLCENEELIHHLKNNKEITLGDLQIGCFSKSHKAADPVFFSVHGNKKVSVITDAGFACKNIIEHVSDSDFLCLESNHDLTMLEQGPYPYFLKKWISSDIGHLSNMQASLCVLEHASSNLKNIVLSHLSEKNNTPKVALKTFSNLIKERSDLNPKISVSQQNLPTSLFRI